MKNIKRAYPKSILVLILTLSIFNSNIYAGGKYVAPVDAPVAFIPTKTPSPWYLGAGLVWAKFHSCGNLCTYEDVTYGAMLRGGYEFNEYFGLELRGVRTFLDEGPFGGVPLQHIGIYVKPQYSISERVNMYALLGYGYTQNLGNGARLNYFDHDHGFSAGIGLEYDLSDRKGDLEKNRYYEREFDGYADQGKGWSLFIDYQRLLIKSDVPDMDVISVGIRYDF
jgi:OOP family OmpA-OmpF porin